MNPELGSASEFDTLMARLQEAAMGWLQDIVPNHMAYHERNWRLMDVLENPEKSLYRGYFDIDWRHPLIHPKVLAPFLGQPYPECLESGEIALHYDERGLSIRYLDTFMPVRLESYSEVLQPGRDDIEEAAQDSRGAYLELAGLFREIADVPAPETMDRSALFKKALWERYAGNRNVRDWIDRRVCSYTGKPGLPESFDRLDRLVGAQNFKPSFWKTALDEINYRRFFTINGLIGLRVEQDDAFLDTHALILRLLREKKLTGLRIDHIDGLYDPSCYLRRLRGEAGEVYTVVEKILGPCEELPEGWTVQGTTGYEFLNRVNGLFCDESNEGAFSRVYQKFSGCRTPYHELLTAKRRLVLEQDMAGDLDNHARRLHELVVRSRQADFTLRKLRRALAEILISIPVYRTYLTEEPARDADRESFRKAFEAAGKRCSDLKRELRFLEDRFTGAQGACRDLTERRHWVSFLMGLQQLMGSLMAKGFEDTILYVFNRFISLNEVGGTPDRFGATIAEFHHFNERRMARFPHTMNTTSTHDTKRGEDIRARLNVISEIPDDWERHVREWERINRRKKIKLREMTVPDRNFEYFLYQTIVGALPFAESLEPDFVLRVKQYAVKAAREAKMYSSWLEPDQAYEEALMQFVDKLLKAAPRNHFLSRFLPFQRRIAFYGIFNSLSQTLIKITSPGSPDFYSGTELWDLNLVDPDNRRPVNFGHRSSLLRELKAQCAADLPGLVKDLLRHREDGRLKMFLIWRALQTRKRKKQLFQAGAYERVEVCGRFQDHIIAFQRREGSSRAITVAPRFLTALVSEGGYPLGRETWQDTAIKVPGKIHENRAEWHEMLTDCTLQGGDLLMVGDILREFPAGLLLSEGEQ